MSNSLGAVQQTNESKYTFLTWKDRLSSYNGKSITYDVAGNPKQYGDTTYVWAGKQLVEIQPGDGSKTQFDYDADGLRTQKRQYGTDGKLEYLVDYVWQNGKLTQQILTLMGYRSDGSAYKVGPINTKFVYDGNSDQPTACFVGEQQMLFVRNLQGDIIAVATSDGEVVAEFSYDAWGNMFYRPQNGTTQEQAQRLVQLCPITYRGYNYDFCTGLYYLQSRYYNPKWGRFLNCDDTNILLSTRGEDHGANLFAYGNNNPVNRVDYAGYECEELIGNILVYVLLPLVIISQKFESLGLSHILDKATPKFQLIYDASGILTYRFQLIFYTYSSQYVYYQELLDFDFYYANYNTWDYYLRNYNRKVPMTGLLKSGIKKGAKALFKSLGAPAIIASIATKITLSPIAKYAKQNDSFVKNSKNHLDNFKNKHSNYEETMFFAFGAINCLYVNYTTGETHIRTAYKGDERIEACI